MKRNILAVFLGLILGGVFNMALIMVSNTVYPLPKGVDPNDIKSLKAHVEAHGFPTGALLIVLGAHAGGSLVSGFVCGLIAKRVWYLAASILGLVWTLGGISMLFMLPSPIWFAVTDVVLYVPMALLGVKIGGALTGSNPPTTMAQ